MAPILSEADTVVVTYRRVAKSPKLALTAVATCDRRSSRYIESIRRGGDDRRSAQN